MSVEVACTKHFLSTSNVKLSQWQSHTPQHGQRGRCSTHTRRRWPAGSPTSQVGHTCHPGARCWQRHPVQLKHPIGWLQPYPESHTAAATTHGDSTRPPPPTHGPLRSRSVHDLQRAGAKQTPQNAGSASSTCLKPGTKSCDSVLAAYHCAQLRCASLAGRTCCLITSLA